MKKERKVFVLIFVTSIFLFLSVSFVSASLIGDTLNFINKFLEGKITGNAVNPASSGNLNITSNPTRGKVYLDGVYKGIAANTLLINNINSGIHKVTLVKAGYLNYTNDSVLINPGQTTQLTANLIINKSNISINSNPTGAGVYFDSVYFGLTPFSLNFVSIGIHNVTLTKDGYLNYTNNSVLISLEKTTRLNVDLTRVPSCANACTLGAKQCNARKNQTCVMNSSSGCTYWEGIISCSTGQCTNGYCTNGCSNQCSLGNKQCAGNINKSCIINISSGCTIWNGNSNCPNPQTCLNGFCTGCTNLCTLGQKQCSNNINQTCVTGANGCTIWSGNTNCPSGKVCSSGVCTNPPSAPITILACSPNCLINQTCVSGVCRYNSSCNGTDINRDGIVDIKDYKNFTKNYLDNCRGTALYQMTSLSITNEINSKGLGIKCNESNILCNLLDLNNDGYLTPLDTPNSNCPIEGNLVTGTENSDLNKDNIIDTVDRNIMLNLAQTFRIGSLCCIPQCIGKTCGASDSCGGICNGTCTSGKMCSNGVCVCAPNCAGKTCGASDNCGGLCNGTCPTGKTCTNKQCVNIDTTNCSDSDNGKNYSQKGNTFEFPIGAPEPGRNYRNENDSCFDNKNLYEYFCQGNNQLGMELYSCPVGQGCSNGACISCINQCTVGAKQCSGRINQTCITNASSGCTIWTGSSACANGLSCNRGYCVNYQSNNKNMSKYSERETFLISDNNWKDVLPFVSVAVWNGSENCQKGYGTDDSTCVYPVLIWHNEEEITNVKLKLEDFSVYSYQIPNLVYNLSLSKDNVSSNESFIISVSTNYTGSPLSGGAWIYLNNYPEYFVPTSDNGNIGYWYPVFNPGMYIFNVTFNFPIIPKSFDADSIIYFMQQYSPSKVNIIGNTPQELDNLLIVQPQLGAGLTQNQIQRIDPSDYLSYWKLFSDVVYVEDNYELALLASTYASLINAPLIIKGSNLDTSTIFANRNIICVGNVNPVGAPCSQNYTLEQLQQKYVQMTNTDKIILVNPNDLNISLLNKFKTAKSSNEIYQTYSKTSLAAPILASAKKELILSTNSEGINPFYTNEQEILDKFNKIDDFLAKIFNSSLIPPKYLTIFSSHLAIPSSSSEKYDSDSKENLDWKYAAMDNQNINTSISFGRIFGISISDVSSYIGRSIFYDKLFNSIYPDGKMSILSIGHSRPQYARNAENIISSARLMNYNAKCYNDVPNEICINTTIQPPLDEYRKKQIITFADHGNSGGWYQTLYSNNLPDFDLSFTISKACSPNDVWFGKGMTFGPNVIRKGAIANSGGSGTTPSLGGICSKKENISCWYDTNCKNQKQFILAMYKDKILFQNYIEIYPDILIYDLSKSRLDKLDTKGTSISSIKVYEDIAVSSEYNNTDYYLHVYNISNNQEISIGNYISYNFDINSGKIVFLWNKLGDYYYNLYVYDLNNKNETLIKRSSSYITQPSIQGNKIIWVDNRNSKMDIYMYDIDLKTEVKITGDNAKVAYWASPKIYGNKIIWVDNRNSKMDIYMYDIDLKTEVKITGDNAKIAEGASPSLYKDTIVWQDNINGLSNIYLYNISKNSEEKIETGNYMDSVPYIYGDILAFTGLVTNLDGNEDVFIYNLSSKRLTKIPGDEDFGICAAGILPNSAAIKYISENSNISLGELYLKISMDPILNKDYYKYYKLNLYIADPTLKPRWI